MSLVGEIARELFLRDALEAIEDRDELVVIDTALNLGLLTVNALICADVVLAPVSCEDEASVQGLAELRATLVKLSRQRATVPELVTGSSSAGVFDKAGCRSLTICGCSISLTTCSSCRTPGL